MKKGDIITAIEGSTVQSLEQLQKQLTYYEAGSTVTITVKRASANGEYKEQEIKIKLTDKKTMEAASESEDSQNKSSSPAAPGNGNVCIAGIWKNERQFHNNIKTPSGGLQLRPAGRCLT